jgi:hypothetical protein
MFLNDCLLCEAYNKEHTNSIMMPILENTLAKPIVKRPAKMIYMADFEKNSRKGWPDIFLFIKVLINIKNTDFGQFNAFK